MKKQPTEYDYVAKVLSQPSNKPTPEQRAVMHLLNMVKVLVVTLAIASPVMDALMVRGWL